MAIVKELRTHNQLLQKEFQLLQTDIESLNEQIKLPEQEKQSNN